MKRAVTVKDIAAALGVSAMTVSRAMTGSNDVAEETRRRVLEKAAEMNYRPNRWARSLVTNKSWLVGLVVPDISHNFYSEITRGAQEVLQAAGYNLLLGTSNRDVQTEIQQIELFMGSRCEGLLLVSEQSEPDVVQEIRRQGVGLVLIDRYFPAVKCSHMTTDDHKVGSLAAEYLLDIGHKRIAFLAGPDNTAGRYRREGFLDALSRRAHVVEDAWIERGNFRFADSCLASHRLLRGAHRPTAIFAANDMSAFGAIRACRELGLAVPGDVSIIGAGNIEGDQHPNPFLTTINWDRVSMGRAAARALLDQMAGSKAPVTHKMFAPELLVRHSTAPRNGAP